MSRLDLFHYIENLDYSKDESRMTEVESIIDLQLKLNSKKRKISQYYSQRMKYNLWNAVSRQLNPYETAWDGVKPKVICSRAYFKLTEIILAFNLAKIVGKCSHALHLCEAPGGFAQSTLEFIKPIKSTATTIVSDIKFHHTLKGRVNLIYEDILSESPSKLLNVPMSEFITADGAFDVSDSYDNQELISHSLISAEITWAMACQSIGGCFVIKIFDICLLKTWSNILHLKNCYDNVVIVKPPSSRPANSEKYVVCTGFNGWKPRAIEQIINIDDISENIIKMSIEYQNLHISNALDNIKNNSDILKKTRAVNQAKNLVVYRENYPEVFFNRNPRG